MDLLSSAPNFDPLDYFAILLAGILATILAWVSAGTFERMAWHSPAANRLWGGLGLLLYFAAFLYCLGHGDNQGAFFLSALVALQVLAAAIYARWAGRSYITPPDWGDVFLMFLGANALPIAALAAVSFGFQTALTDAYLTFNLPLATLPIVFTIAVWSVFVATDHLSRHERQPKFLPTGTP